MTREEAIDVLKHNYPSSCYEDLCKAVDMAIKALEQPEPSQVARDIATIVENEQDMRVMLSQQWIPVSERLPENDKPVLICTADGWETDAQYDKDYYRCTATEWEWHDDWGDYRHIKDIVAWMPLPKPYKGDDAV